MDRKVARDFFQQHLDKSLRERLNWDTLEYQGISFIDHRLRYSACDVLYKVTFSNRPAYLYVLLEHQSAPDQMMPFRVLKYTCNIIDRHLQLQMKPKNRVKPIPLVVPLVFYTGKKKYRYSNDINTLVNASAEDVERYFLKPFKLIDLKAIDDEQIRERVWSGLVELVMKYPTTDSSEKYDNLLISCLKIINQQDGGQLIKVVLRYILGTTGRKNPEQLVEQVAQALQPNKEHDMLTMAEYFEQKGVARGEQRGGERAKLEVAQFLLKAGSKPEFVAEATGLPLGQIEKLLVA